MVPPIGFVLVTYKNPQQISRLVAKLNEMFDHPPIACHHDFFKSELRTDALGENFTLVRPHLLTGWGVFAVVEAMLQALELLYRRPDSPDWFIFLSEADYPIKPAPKILEDLASSPYDAHMHHEKIIYNNYERDWQRLCFTRYCTVKYGLPFLNRRLQPTRRTLSIGHPLFTSAALPFSKDFHCFAGAHWFCANRKAAEHLIEFHKSEPALAKHYRRMDRFTVVPEESYYHTVLCNAPDLTISRNNWRYVDWSEGRSRPKILSLEDMPQIEESTAHFARKFDIDRDAEILSELDYITK